MNGNSHPGSTSPSRKSKLEVKMRAYDRLPLRLRRALADAPYRFSAISVQEAFERWGENRAWLMLERAVERESGIALQDMRDGTGPFARG